MLRLATFIPLFIFLFHANLIIAHPGIGIVMDSQGNVYYTDLNHVWKISPDGSHTIAVENVHTHELFLDENNDLYGEHVWYEGEVIDKWGYYFWRLKNSGELERLTPPTEGFPLNNTLVRDCEGNTYWQEKSGDHELLKKQTSAGKIALHTNHQFQDIRWMYIPRGKMELYVIDFLTLKKVEPNGQVKIISNQLKETKLSHAFVGDRHNLMGMWSDNMENLYVAVFGGKVVKKITPNGEIEIISESRGNWSPSGGLAAPDGSLWVLEYSINNKARVKKISANGEEVIFQP